MFDSVPIEVPRTRTLTPGSASSSTEERTCPVTVYPCACDEAGPVKPVMMSAHTVRKIVQITGFHVSSLFITFSPLINYVLVKNGFFCLNNTALLLATSLFM